MTVEQEFRALQERAAKRGIYLDDVPGWFVPKADLDRLQAAHELLGRLGIHWRTTTDREGADGGHYCTADAAGKMIPTCGCG